MFDEATVVVATREEEVEEAEREAGADGASVEGRGEVVEEMVVVTMEEEVRGVGGKVMGVRVVKHEVVEAVEEGGEGSLGSGGGMRVEEESGGVGRVEEEREEVDMGVGVKMGKEEEGGVGLGGFG